MAKENIIEVNGLGIRIKDVNYEKYVSLTDIAKKKNPEEPRFVIINWLKNRNTIEFLGIWEKIHNLNFNRVELDTVKSEAGLNSFTISPSKWIKETNAIGLLTKSGRYGSGTYAHEDIALEFASWISAEFKLYFIKEFRRLKYQEKESLKTSWDVKRELVKINYKIHTDAIKEKLIPPEISKKEAKLVYATEADLLNKALFGMTAKEWKEVHFKKEGNMRDYANVAQLVVLANLQSLNSEYIKKGSSSSERLIELNRIAISQLKSLIKSKKLSSLEKRKYLS